MYFVSQKKTPSRSRFQHHEKATLEDVFESFPRPRIFPIVIFGFQSFFPNDSVSETSLEEADDDDDYDEQEKSSSPSDMETPLPPIVNIRMDRGSSSFPILVTHISGSFFPFDLECKTTRSTGASLRASFNFRRCLALE